LNKGASFLMFQSIWDFGPGLRHSKLSYVTTFTNLA
jgi:hypothetical protein